jgi:hypothetical protein
MAGDTKRTEDYSNVDSMPIRTRIALLLILMAIKICEPWNYAHQFEADLKAIQDALLGKEVKK